MMINVDRRGFLKLGGVAAIGTTGLLSGCIPGGSEGEPAEGGGIVHAAYMLPIATLNPYEAGSTVHEPALMARRLVFDTLTQRTDKGIEGRLAKSWKQTSDTSWEIELVAGATFADGSAANAASVKASLNTMRNTENEQSPLWAAIDKVEAPDETTVSVETSRPLGTLPVNLTMLFITQAGEGEDQDYRKPNGSGPYEVSKFTPASSLSLKARDKYWGEAPANKELELPFIPETSSATTALLNSEIDLLWPIPPDQIKEVESGKGVVLEALPSWMFFAIWFNCSAKPFTDSRVRRALWHAVDAPNIIESLYGKAAVPMRAPIPESVFGFSEQEPYDYDPDKARQLLADAGADGLKSSMMWFDETGPLARQLAQAFISAWKDVGVTVKGESIQRADWVARLNKLDWDLELQTHTVSTGDADYNLGRLYVSSANRLGYSNEKLDKALAAGAENADEDQRAEHYADACRMIWDDAAGIYIANLVTTYGMRDTVEGFVPAASNQPDLSTVLVK